MAFKHKNNSGSLFKNERKEKDTHPNMTGSAVIDDKEYWVSAWTKDGDKGRWQSLSFKLKTHAGDSPSPEPQPRVTDDEIPF